MKINRKEFAILIIIVPFFNCLNLSGQNIKFQNLTIDTIPEILRTNDSIINPRMWPLPSDENNGLAPRITSTKLFYSKSDPESKRIMEVFEKIANDYIVKNNIIDNNDTEEKYALTIEGNQFLLRKHKTIKRYLYGEGAGVRSYISIDEEPGYQENNILLIFNKNVNLSDNIFEMDSILPESGCSFIPPYKRINYLDSENNYEFLYTSGFCSDHFQFRGLGTILPTFFNLDLRITDLKTGKSNILIQYPHDHDFKIKSIGLGDINKDNKKDIILTIETMLCMERILFLSSNNPDIEPFIFVGRMTIYCDYP